MPESFIVNVADTRAVRHERGGWSADFEAEDAPFEHVGVNIRVLDPGQANGMYHSETVEEHFLVLGGECLLIMDGKEHLLKQWDFVHCPPGTNHIFVGAGDGPSTILMVGGRGPDGQGLHYPANAVAAAHGASVAEDTSSPREAYADWSREFTPGRMPWPPA
jgi:uncharacterized cupin superfamily protein